MKKSTLVLIFCILMATFFALYFMNDYFEVSDLEQQASFIQTDIDRLKNCQETISADLLRFAEKTLESAPKLTRTPRNSAPKSAAPRTASALFQMLDERNVQSAAYDELRLRYNNNQRQLADAIVSYNLLVDNYHSKALSPVFSFFYKLFGRKPLRYLAPSA